MTPEIVLRRPEFREKADLLLAACADAVMHFWGEAVRRYGTADIVAVVIEGEGAIDFKRRTTLLAISDVPMPRAIQRPGLPGERRVWLMGEDWSASVIFRFSKVLP
jgi:hypothetical protein